MDVGISESLIVDQTSGGQESKGGNLTGDYSTSSKIGPPVIRARRQVIWCFDCTRHLS